MLFQLCLPTFVLVCMAAATQQYVAFDAASASSTYSEGSSAGSPAYGAQHALSSGSGYWCSSGSHAAGQSVMWTGVLNSRRIALGVKVAWAYSPGEVKVLISSDGSNFEEAKCWQSSTRSEVAFEETFMFGTPTSVKAVTIAMRSPQSWGYFGINSAALLTEPGPLMLVSGITSSSGERCVVSTSSGIRLESCLEAIAAGDGREVLVFDKEGQILSTANGRCLTLVDGDTSGGGKFAMDVCSDSATSGDGRTVFAASPNGQLKMSRIGNYCLTMVGDSSLDIDVAQGADVAATSSNAEHAVSNVVDGDGQSYWSSGFDPSSPVDVQLHFGAAMQINTIAVDWEHPAQAFELQVASGGKWMDVYRTSGNNAQSTKYVGPGVSGTSLRLRMTKPHPTLGSSGGHAVYGIRSIRVLGTSAHAVVQDCVEAEGNQDARDKFFMVAVPEFDPSVASAATQNAALLGAAEEHLGNLLATMYAAMPSLAACGFKASFEKRPLALMRQAAASMSEGVFDQDATSAAVAAIAPAMGVDMRAFQTLVQSTRAALTQVSR